MHATKDCVPFSTFLVKVKSGNEWIEVPSFSVTSIPEAPTDGKQYARQNANWTEV